MRTRATSAALTVLLLASACSGQADNNESQANGAPVPSETATALERFYAQALHWSGCGGEFECATVKVPLDYEAPEGETIDLALLRAPATKPEDRIGSLLVLHNLRPKPAARPPPRPHAPRPAGRWTPRVPVPHPPGPGR